VKHGCCTHKSTISVIGHGTQRLVSSIHAAEVTSLGRHIRTRFSRLTGHFCSFLFPVCKAFACHTWHSRPWPTLRCCLSCAHSRSQSINGLTAFCCFDSDVTVACKFFHTFPNTECEDYQYCIRDRLVYLLVHIWRKTNGLP
jgi:hypothetical protein